MLPLGCAAGASDPAATLPPLLAEGFRAVVSGWHRDGSRTASIARAVPGLCRRGRDHRVAFGAEAIAGWRPVLSRDTPAGLSDPAATSLPSLAGGNGRSRRPV